MSVPKFVFLMEPPQAPPTTGVEWIDWINAVAALALAGVGIWGLNAWRREHRAKRVMELAEKILATSYECFDAIDHIRHGWQPAHEVEKVERNEEETERDHHRRRYFEVTFRRYNEQAPKFAELMSLRFRAEVLFTTEHRTAMEEVQVLVNKVTGAAQSAFRIRVLQDRLSDRERSQARVEELFEAYDAQESVFSTLKPKEKDPFYPTLKAARDNLERLFKRAAADGKLR